MFAPISVLSRIVKLTTSGILQSTKYNVSLLLMETESRNVIIYNLQNYLSYINQLVKFIFFNPRFHELLMFPFLMKFRIHRNFYTFSQLPFRLSDVLRAYLYTLALRHIRRFFITAFDWTIFHTSNHLKLILFTQQQKKTFFDRSTGSKFRWILSPLYSCYNWIFS